MCINEKKKEKEKSLQWSVSIPRYVIKILIIIYYY